MNIYLKKTLSVLFAILMVVTSVPFAFAAEPDIDCSVDGHTFESGKCSACGISKTIYIHNDSENYVCIDDDISIKDGSVYTYEVPENKTEFLVEVNAWIVGNDQDGTVVLKSTESFPVTGENMLTVTLPNTIICCDWSVCGDDITPHVLGDDAICDICGSMCLHTGQTGKICGICKSERGSDGTPLTIDVTDKSVVEIGSEHDYYDADGYILTGTSKAYVYFYEGCDFTVKDLNLVQLVFNDAPENSVFNITLDGSSEISSYVSFTDEHLVFNGTDEDTFKAPYLSTSGNPGSVIVNGGNIILSREECETSTIDTNGGFIINGGKVTAANDYWYAVWSDVMLNGGEFNIVSTAADNEAVNSTITMKKGTLLTVSAQKGILYDSTDDVIVMADAGENDCFFVRYDKTSDFVPVSDIKAALEGKTYAEIKIGEHTHSYTNGKCVCGYECLHENFENKKCTVCGIDCPHNSYTNSVCNACGTLCTHNSYTNGICDTCEARCAHKNVTNNICNTCKLEFKGFELYVAGVLATSSNYNDILGSADSGATARYNPETNTLTLENLSVSDKGGIYCNKSLNIELKGKNSITVSDEDEKAIYILSHTDDIKLVIGGDGELELTSDGDGIYMESLMNSEADIKDSAKIKINSRADGIGIYGYFAGLTVRNNAKVELAVVSESILLIGESASLLVKDNGEIIIVGDDEGIYMSTTDDCNVTFKDNAKVSITTTDEEGIYIYSKEGKSTVTVSGNAEVHIDGDEEGVQAAEVIVTGGTLDVSGTGTYVGIMAEKLEISGGAVKATGGDEAPAISADEITVTGGSLEAKTSADLPACVVAPDFSGYKTEKKLYASVNADGSDLVEYKAEDNDKYKYFSLECVHKEATDKGFEATCNKTGLTDGSHCTVCGIILTAQKEIPVVSHTDANGDYKCDFGCGHEFPKPTEPTTQPSGGTTEPTTKPVETTKPAETTAKPVETTKPVEPTTAKPVETTKPVENTTAKPVETTTNITTEPTTKPSAEPTTKPSVETTTKPTTQPTTNPVENTTNSSGVSTTEQTTQHKHTEEVVKGKAATCTKKGLTDGKKCSTCGVVTVKQKEIKALGHKEVTVKGKSATCTKTGLTDGKKCSTCGTVTVKQKEIKPLGHKEVKVKAVKATYTKTGKTEGKKCSVCGKVTVKQKKVARKKLKKVSGIKTKTVKLEKGSKSSLTLSWKKVTGAEKYVVQQYVNKKWKTVATTKKTSYTVKKLKANKTYKFRVRAKAGKYYGEYSKTYSAKTVPLKPTVTVKAGKKQLTASWKKVANITGYEVQYSTSKKFTKKTTKKVTIKKAKTTKKTIKKLKKGKKYYVRVRAYKTVNGKKICSSWSKVKSVKVK